VAYSGELDVSSCSTTKAKTQGNLLEAVWYFWRKSRRKAPCNKYLREAGCPHRKQMQLTGEILTVLKTTLTVAP
jgi:hypothetical protein